MNNEYAKKFQDAYHKHYNRIPNDWEGALLMEAINQEFIKGDKCSDLIEAYQMNKPERAMTILWQILDDYRADVAALEANKTLARQNG